MALLRRAPALESLTFGLFFTHDKNTDAKRMVPECRLSHLKVVEFNLSYISEDDWINLARFLLTNAMILEKMMIKSCASLSTNGREQLLECPRCFCRSSVVFSKYCG